MMVVDRHMDYSDVVDTLRGKRVLIWTCNTCARLCDGLGGRKAAEDLSARLSKDGIETIGIVCPNAICATRDLAEQTCGMVPEAVLTMCCDTGIFLCKEVLGVDTTDLLKTLGPGYIGHNGRVHLTPGL